MHFAEGIVDLCQHTEQLCRWRVTVEEADRVKDIVKVAGGGDQQNLAEGSADAQFVEHLFEFLPNRLISGPQIILVVNRHRSQLIVTK